MTAFEAFVREFKRRKIHTRLNARIIASISDDNLVQAVVDYIGVAIGKDWEHDQQKVPELGPGFAAIYFLSLVETEVNNGGFNQLFYNQGREAVVQARQGAELLRLRNLAALLAEALELETGYRETMAVVKRKGTIESFMASYEDIDFGALDDRFSKAGRTLEKSLVSFIRRRSELFTGKAGR